MSAKRKKRTLKDGLDLRFDFSSLTFENQEEDRQEERTIPRLSYTPVDYKYAEDMAKRIDWQQDYIALLAGTFVFGDFLEALLYRKVLLPERMYVTTLGMNAENVDSLVNLVKYLYCKELNLIVSHYFAGVERHNLMPYMEKEFAGLPINIGVLQSHAKICTIRSGKGDGVIVGSANLSSSNNVEQVMILHDPATIDYLEGQLAGIMDRFTVYRGLDKGKINWDNNKDNVGLKAYEALKHIGGADNGEC